MSSPANPQLNELALNLSPLIALIGLAFMAKCKEIWLDIMFLPVMPKALLRQLGENFKYIAVPACHLAFMLGVIVFAFSMWPLGLAMKLPTQLAALPTFLIITTEIWRMRILCESPLGVQGINGPPLPAVIINTFLSILLSMNAYVNWEYLTTKTSNMKNDPKHTFFTILAIGLLMPRIFSSHHRAHGWMEGFEIDDIEKRREAAEQRFNKMGRASRVAHIDLDNIESHIYELENKKVMVTPKGSGNAEQKKAK